jgi:phage terminase small subunit
MTRTPILTDRQKKFAELLVYNEGKMSPAEAAFEAGYKTRPRQSASELKNPKVYPLVARYVGELRSEVQEKYGINFEKHITELAKIRNEALKKGAWSAAVNAEVARGKAGGLYIDQKLIMTGNVDNLSAEEIKEKLRKILEDNKEIINITPDEIELDKLELEPKSNLGNGLTKQ